MLKMLTPGLAQDKYDLIDRSTFLELLERVDYDGLAGKRSELFRNVAAKA